MKMIVGIFPPERLPYVKAQLAERQFERITVTNALGSIEGEAYMETYRGVAKQVTLFKRVRIELFVNDDRVEAAIEAIVEGARTGGEHDGKVFVVELVQAVRIADGARGSRIL